MGAEPLKLTSKPEICKKLEFGIGKTESDRSKASFS